MLKLALTAVVALAAAAWAANFSAHVHVIGYPEGFAEGTTGGGNVQPVYPTTTSELENYLMDAVPRVIVLTKVFDFTNTQGVATLCGCSPYGTDARCQIAINKNGWCDKYQGNAPKVHSIQFDQAGMEGLTVTSDKTLVGRNGGGLKGRGLRMYNASNIIIQNIAITDINPRFVWGGDGITLNLTNLVWIDHVTTARIGRQHLVTGPAPSGRVSITNCEFDGHTDYSATCDGHTYWGMYFDGSGDFITMKNNYIHHFSGRCPKVQTNTLLHAVNNVFFQNSGHAFEISTGGYVHAEGNTFINITQISDITMTGKLFVSPHLRVNTRCTEYLGRMCEYNFIDNSGTNLWVGANPKLLRRFKGKGIAPADMAKTCMENVVRSAGNSCHKSSAVSTGQLCWRN